MARTVCDTTSCSARLCQRGQAFAGHNTVLTVLFFIPNTVNPNHHPYRMAPVRMLSAQDGGATETLDTLAVGAHKCLLLWHEGRMTHGRTPLYWRPRSPCTFE